MGGQQSMFALIKNLDRARFTPYAIVPYEGELSERLRKVQCVVFSVPLMPLKPKYLIRQLRNITSIVRIIRNNCIDVVHPDHERDAFIAGIACKLTNAKMVWHVRLTRKVGTDKMTFFLSDRVIGIAEDVRKRFEGFSGIDKIYSTIYNGVDCDVFRPADKKESKSALGIDPAKFVVTYAGQFKRGKGILELIQAAGLVESENIHFMLIGKPENDEFLKEMNDLIKSGNLEQKISIQAFKREIQHWFAASDIVVLPSHEGTEGMGRVLFEAMACGSAVIGTDISGVRQAISPETGLLIKEKSASALANAIDKLFKNNELRQSMEKFGRKRALDFFDIRNHARSVETIYEQLVSENKEYVC